jgi:hypothetical protein
MIGNQLTMELNAALARHTHVEDKAGPPFEGVPN